MQNNPTPWFPPLRGEARGAVRPARPGSPSKAEHDPAKLASHAAETPQSAALAGGHRLHHTRGPRPRPKISDATNRTRKTTNRILAIPVAVPAIPPKPSTAAKIGRAHV